MVVMAKLPKCPDCLFPIGQDDYGKWCSDFCVTTPVGDRRKWHTAKTGESCVYPCSVCGCAVEDELQRDQTCALCGPVVRLKRLLRRCLRHVPDKLKAEIRQAVRR